MTSKIKVDNINKVSDDSNIINKCGTTITLGASGDSIALASGATQTGFGRTGTVDWDTTPKTATFSAVSGNGYFCNTTSSAFTVNLPAGVAGAIVSLADYAATWQTNNVTVVPNGTDKIGSLNENAFLSTQGQSVTFVYVDSTQGWINTMDSTSNVRGVSPFIAATGGTITECGDFKIHTFTGPGTFCVTGAGTPTGSTTVDYLVVAGGGGAGGEEGSGGGGAGGFRESSGAASGCYSRSPLGACVSGLPVSVQGYSIVVGGGGAGGTGAPKAQGTSGSVSTFSSITSTGGGGGGYGNAPSPDAGLYGLDGGSGGGSGGRIDTPYQAASKGQGNTPSVSPPQGQPGGASKTDTGNSNDSGGGGGGATATGSNAANPEGPSGNGGAGATTSISATPTAYAGGGAGGNNSGGTSAGTGGTGGGGNGSNNSAGGAGTGNTGGGGGGAGTGVPGNAGGAGGSGIVIIRYKFQ